MPVFDEGWQPKKGHVQFEVEERHMVDVWVSCTKEVTLYGVRKAEKVLLKKGTEFRFRSQLKGYRALRIEGTGQTEFGLKVEHSPIIGAEPNSGEKAPVLQLPEPSNLLQKMRRMQREAAQFSRYPVLEPDDFPSFGRYEIDDDDVEVLFEEEAVEIWKEKREKARREAEEKARTKAEAPHDGEKVKSAPSPEPQKPAPETQGSEGQVDPPPKEAANQ